MEKTLYQIKLLRNVGYGNKKGDIINVIAENEFYLYYRESEEIVRYLDRFLEGYVYVRVEND